MKTIIVPVDFSDASTNALLFAAEISKRASSLLIVVNIIRKDEDEATATDKMKIITSDLKKSFGSGLKCKSLLAEGSIISGLKKIIVDWKPDLVVMGTKGASGIKRILIGSNTVNVLAKTKVPVLIIPEKAKFETFLRKGKNRIVLATDLDELKNETPLIVLKEIALLVIDPKIRVLSVRPKKTGLGFLKDMERRVLLSAFKPEIETERVTVFSDNVMKGIKYYLNKNKDTGLIAMIARNSGALVQKHYTREMASHTKFPLLVLHEAK